MGDPPRQRDEGVLRGAVIYIQSRGRDLREVFDEVRFIQSHGGMTMGDPWAPIVTHAIVQFKQPHRDYKYVLDLDYVTSHRPHPSDEARSARRAWPLDRIVDVFTHRNPTYPKRGPVVVQAQWLKDSVSAGYPLGEQDNWGGWLVRSTVRTVSPPTLFELDPTRDPRLRGKQQEQQKQSHQQEPSSSKSQSQRPPPTEPRAGREPSPDLLDAINARRHASGDDRCTWAEYNRDRNRDHDRDRDRSYARGPPPPTDLRDIRPSWNEYNNRDKEDARDWNRRSTFEGVSDRDRRDDFARHGERRGSERSVDSDEPHGGHCRRNSSASQPTDRRGRSRSRSRSRSPPPLRGRFGSGSGPSQPLAGPSTARLHIPRSGSGLGTSRDVHNGSLSPAQSSSTVDSPVEGGKKLTLRQRFNLEHFSKPDNGAPVSKHAPATGAMSPPAVPTTDPQNAQATATVSLPRGGMQTPQSDPRSPLFTPISSTAQSTPRHPLDNNSMAPPPTPPQRPNPLIGLMTAVTETQAPIVESPVTMTDSEIEREIQLIHNDVERRLSALGQSWTSGQNGSAEPGSSRVPSSGEPPTAAPAPNTINDGETITTAAGDERPSQQAANGPVNYEESWRPATTHAQDGHEEPESQRPIDDVNQQAIQQEANGTEAVEQDIKPPILIARLHVLSPADMEQYREERRAAELAQAQAGQPAEQPVAGSSTGAPPATTEDAPENKESETKRNELASPVKQEPMEVNSVSPVAESARTRVNRPNPTIPSYVVDEQPAAVSPHVTVGSQPQRTQTSIHEGEVASRGPLSTPAPPNSGPLVEGVQPPAEPSNVAFEHSTTGPNVNESQQQHPQQQVIQSATALPASSSNNNLTSHEPVQPAQPTPESQASTSAIVPQVSIRPHQSPAPQITIPSSRVSESTSMVSDNSNPVKSLNPTISGPSAAGASAAENVPISVPTGANPAPLSRNPQGIFAVDRLVPMTFHVVEVPNKKMFEDMIITAGGGLLAPLSQADWVILPLQKGAEPTQPEHVAIAARQGISVVAHVVSRDWIVNSVLYETTLLDPVPYLVPVPKQSQAGDIPQAAPPLQAQQALGHLSSISSPLTPVSDTVTAIPSTTTAGTKRNRAVSSASPAVDGPGPSTMNSRQAKKLRRSLRIIESEDESDKPVQRAGLPPKEIESLDSDFEDFAPSDSDDDNGSSSGPDTIDRNAPVYDRRVSAAEEKQRVARMIELFKRWDRQGGKQMFIESLRKKGVPSPFKLYTNNRDYIHSQLPWLERFTRPGRKSSALGKA